MTNTNVVFFWDTSTQTYHDIRYVVNPSRYQGRSQTQERILSSTRLKERSTLRLWTEQVCVVSACCDVVWCGDVLCCVVLCVVVGGRGVV